MRTPHDRDTLVFADIDGSKVTVASTVAICDREQCHIDSSCLLDDGDPDELKCVRPHHLEIAALSTTLCEQSLHDQLIAQQELSAMKVSICCTFVLNARTLTSTLIDSPNPTGVPMQENSDLGNMNMEEFMDYMIDNDLSGDLDLDSVMASATYAKPSKGVAVLHLSKIWKN